MAERMNGLSIELLSHPGETLQEVLESNNMTQKELAARIGVSPKHINQIVAGLTGISSEVAFKLEKVFNLSSRFWMNLQAKYDSEKMALLEVEQISDAEKAVFQNEIYKSLEKWGYLKREKTTEQKIIQMRDFLGVSSLLNINSTISANALFRKSNKLATDNFALATWMKICEIETNKIDLSAQLDTSLLEQKIPDIRKLMLQEDPNVMIEELREIFAQCGIAFAVVRNVKHAPVQGFIRKINNKMRLCLTLRNKYTDIFWFTLFHEIGHILDGKNDYFVDFVEKDSNSAEIHADKFATETLISKRDYTWFTRRGHFGKKEIVDFSKVIGVRPGIVVGRLQHDKFIPQSFHNDLKDKYMWANE